MAECAYCKAETQLFENDVPVCLRCSEARESKHESADSENQVGTILDREFAAAAERAKAASAGFDATVSEIPSGLPHPDGTQRIHNASHEVSAARIEMMKAHNRLNDFLRRGIVPGDLKQTHR